MTSKIRAPTKLTSLRLGVKRTVCNEPSFHPVSPTGSGAKHIRTDELMDQWFDANCVHKGGPFRPIFVGNDQAPLNPIALRNNHITTIIHVGGPDSSCKYVLNGTDVVPISDYKILDPRTNETVAFNGEYHEYMMSDSASQRLERTTLINIFNIVCSLDDNRMKEGVLIHCHAGKSRSGAIAIAILMHFLKMTCDAALSYVRIARPQIDPNLGFMIQLQNLFERNSFCTYGEENCMYHNAIFSSSKHAQHQQIDIFAIASMHKKSPFQYPTQSSSSSAKKSEAILFPTNSSVENPESYQNEDPFK